MSRLVASLDTSHSRATAAWSATGLMVQLWYHVFDSIRDDPQFRSLEQRVAAAANKAP